MSASDASPDPRGGSEPRPPLVRLMTFNILYGTAGVRGGWAARRPHVVRTLHEHAPDIAGLQEVSQGQLRDLADEFEEGYRIIPGPPGGPSVIALSWVKSVSGTALALFLLVAIVLLQRANSPGVLVPGLAVLTALALASAPYVLFLLSRTLNGNYVETGGHSVFMFRSDRFRFVAGGAFWISNAPDRRGSILPGNYAPHVVHWVRIEPRAGGRAITLFNGHLGHGPWTWKPVAELLRSRMDEAWDGSVQVLLGDFNAAPDSGLLRRLLAPSDGPPPLLDTWREAEVREGHQASYHWRRNYRGWPGRIDHVLVRPRVRVARAAIGTVPEGSPSGSDHDPVVVDLDLEIV